MITITLKIEIDSDQEVRLVDEKGKVTQVISSTQRQSRDGTQSAGANPTEGSEDEDIRPGNNGKMPNKTVNIY